MDFKLSQENMELLEEFHMEVSRMREEFENSCVDKAEMGDWCCRNVERLFQMLEQLLAG
jgi:hypothetical protein